MSASQTPWRPPVPSGVSTGRSTGVSMRDLLASCAAADAVSPRPTADPELSEPAPEHREAA